MPQKQLQFAEADENLRIAEMAYNAGSYKIAFEMLEQLAHYAASSYAVSSVDSADLQHFRNKIANLLAQFSFCKDECLWEKSSELLDLFR